MGLRQYDSSSATGDDGALLALSTNWTCGVCSSHSALECGSVLKPKHGHDGHVAVHVMFVFFHDASGFRPDPGSSRLRAGPRGLYVLSNSLNNGRIIKPDAKLKAVLPVASPRTSLLQAKKVHRYFPTDPVQCCTLVETAFFH